MALLWAFSGHFQGGGLKRTRPSLRCVHHFTPQKAIHTVKVWSKFETKTTKGSGVIAKTIIRIS